MRMCNVWINVRQGFVIYGFELKCHDCLVVFPKPKLFHKGSPLHALSGQGVVAAAIHDQVVELL